MAQKKVIFGTPAGLFRNPRWVISVAVSDSSELQHLPCPFCGKEPGHLFMVKVFCSNEECAIFDLPIDAHKWNGRGDGSQD
jgi:hypothetical protein